MSTSQDSPVPEGATTIPCARCKSVVERRETEVSEDGWVCLRCARFQDAYASVERARAGTGNAVELAVGFGVLGLAVSAAKTVGARRDANDLENDLRRLEVAAPREARETAPCARCRARIAVEGSRLDREGRYMCPACARAADLDEAEDHARGSLLRGLVAGVMFSLAGLVIVAITRGGRRTLHGAVVGAVVGLSWQVALARVVLG